MIAYLELLDKYTLKPYAIIEPSECWLELSYYEVGAFELYCTASRKNLTNLTKGSYIKIPNKRFIWVITSLSYIYSASGVRMISAKGYEAEWLLNARAILSPVELPLTLGGAIYQLINKNACSGAETSRQIQNLTIAQQDLDITLAPTQATRSNLLIYTNELLKAYNCGCYVYYDEGALKYEVIKGRDLTSSIIFAQSYDNLINSEYFESNDNLRTYAQVVSHIEDIDYIQVKDNGTTGIDRLEMIVDSNLSTSYTDSSGQEQTTTPTSDLFKGWQVEEGKKALSENTITTETKAEINIDNSQYVFDEDYFLGDLVKIRDEYFNYSTSARITKATIKQDAKGYGVLIDYN